MKIPLKLWIQMGLCQLWSQTNIFASLFVFKALVKLFMRLLDFKAKPLQVAENLLWLIYFFGLGAVEVCANLPKHLDITLAKMKNG